MFPFVGPTGKAVIDLDRSFWAKITGYDPGTGRYSWQEVQNETPPTLWTVETVSQIGVVRTTPGTATAVEVQTAVLGRVTGGTWGIAGRPNTGLPFDATAGQVQVQIDAAFGAGAITVTGGGPYTLTWIANGAHSLVSVDGSLLTPITPLARSGGFSYEPAFEISGDPNIPVDTIVRMYRGFYDPQTYGQDYRFAKDGDDTIRDRVFGRHTMEPTGQATNELYGFYPGPLVMWESANGQIANQVFGKRPTTGVFPVDNDTVLVNQVFARHTREPSGPATNELYGFYPGPSVLWESQNGVIANQVFGKRTAPAASPLDDDTIQDRVFDRHTMEPTGQAQRDLGGFYPAPLVIGINGNPLGSTTPYAGNILVADGVKWNSVAMGGEARIDDLGFVLIEWDTDENVLANQIFGA